MHNKERLVFFYRHWVTLLTESETSINNFVLCQLTNDSMFWKTMKHACTLSSSPPSILFCYIEESIMDVIDNQLREQINRIGVCVFFIYENDAQRERIK